MNDTLQDKEELVAGMRRLTVMLDGENRSGMVNFRKQAEEKAAASPEDIKHLSPNANDTRLLAYELRVHQIELEMQNEELLRTLTELDAVRLRYFDLYNLAPVGYITLDKTNLILEANLTAATMLGVIRGILIAQPISNVILRDDQDAFYCFRNQLIVTGKLQTCELRIVKSDGSLFWAQMSATVTRKTDGAPVCRLVLADITERKRAAEALHASEIQLQGIIESTADGILAVDNEGKVIKANSRFAELWRISQELLQSRDDAALLAFALEQLSEPEKFLNKVQSLYKSDASDMDTIAFKDGRVFERYSIPLQMSGSISGRVWSFRDITERKQLEVYRDMSLRVMQRLSGQGDLHESIQGVIDFVKTQTGADAVGLRLQDGEDFPYFAQQGFSEEFLLTENTLTERGPDGGVCRDKNGKVCLENTCGLVLSGKTDPSSPLFTQGGSFWTNDSLPLLDLPQEKDPRIHPRNKCIRQGNASMALIPVRDKERIIGLLHINARRKGCFTLASIKILEDLAAHIGATLTHRRVEAALRESEERFARLAEQSGTFFWDVDAQGLYTYTSPVAEKVLGYHPAEMIGRMHFFDIHPEAGREAFKAEVLEIFQRKESFTDFVNAAQTKDGRAVWLATTGQPLLAADGSLRGYRGSDIDITERRKAEEVVNNITEAKSKFISTVSHEIRSPLAMIKEATSLVFEEVLGPLNDEQKEMMDITKNNIARLGRLVNNVLAYQKIDAQKMDCDFQEQDVNEVVKEAHINAALYAGARKADVMMELGADLPRIKFDPDKIMQVLINLLANAIKYSESGPVVIKTRLGSGEIQFSVQDSGQGIYPEEMDKIFKPFVQAKGKKNGGTGLGLAIAKELVLAHHGRIWGESEIGKGSIFYFTLPL